MREKHAEVLLKSSLFKGISPSDIHAMVASIKAETKSYRKNSFIVMAGDAFASIGVVLEGEAIVLKEDESGSRLVMTMLKAGDIFGEVIAFAGRPLWPASVQAQNECSVLFLPGEKIMGEFNNHCASHRVLVQNILCIIAEKALLLSQKVNYLAIKSMRGKLSTYFLEQYNVTGKKEFVLPLKRNELADYLNVSRPSMSREMARMKNDGIIEYNRSLVKITNLEGIKQCAELSHFLKNALL